MEISGKHNNNISNGASFRHYATAGSRSYIPTHYIYRTRFTNFIWFLPRDNNNNNNKHDNVYGAVIMAEPLRKFTRFI